MSNETIRQKAFNLSWDSVPEYSEPVVDGFYPMRGWQKEAFELLKEKLWMIINAPMGSGKSWLMCLLSAQKMKTNDDLRTIIAVPQTIIAPGFANAKLRMPDGECLHWYVNHNLCKKELSKGTVKYIIHWLKQRHQSFNDRILVCTHATLVQAYKKLKEEGLLHLLTDLLLWVDEAHHVKNIAMEEIEGEAISNGIGDLVKYLLNHKENRTQLGLTTASFFRGDHCSLLTKSMEMQFTRFNLPYDEYLKSMKYLKSFSFDFLLCGYDYTNAVGALARQRKGKDIIYIPHPKSLHSMGDKYQEVQSIIAEYQKIHGGERVAAVGALDILTNYQNDFKVLDLVDEDRRIEKKEFLNNDDLKEQKEALDVIIALGMFKEGANWIWADRSIIVGIRSSLVDIVQMMGRLFRDAKGKQHVEVIQVLPFSLDQQCDGFSDNLNNYLKAIYASLILEDVLNPVRLVPAFSSGREKSLEQTKGSLKTMSMSELIPDDSTRLSVIDDGVNLIASISANNQVGGDRPALYEEFQNALPEILSNYGIHSQSQEIGEKIWGMLLRRSLVKQGIAVEDIDFDIVKITHPLEGLLRYTSGACGIETLTQLHEAIRSYKEEKNAVWDFNYSLLEKYIEEHGNCRAPKDYEVTTNDKVVKLGSWFSDQKKNFASLSLNRQELLQKLPGFVAKKFHRNKNLSIDEWIDLFISVSKKLGTSLIPNTHVENGVSIGGWLQHIRKKQEWEKLTPEQKNRLLNNNFKLSPKEEWGEAAVLAMNQFFLREGHTTIKCAHKEEVVHKGIRYSIRLDNLRNNIKHSPSKVEKTILESIVKIPNFLEELQDNKEDTGTYLENGLKAYNNFNKRTGLIIVPDGYVEDGFDLFRWNKKVRLIRTLDDDFRLRLLAIDPLFFSKHSVRVFNQELRPRIEGFLQENGHALVPQGYVCSDDFPLGEKIADLRERKTKLEKPILDYLSSLGNKWAGNYFEYLHLQGMEELASYFELNGYHKSVLPKKIRELIRSVKKAIPKYSSSEALKRRIEELAPGIFDEPQDENYLALLRYAIREGHACPPIKHIEEGKKIGIYVSNVRQKYKNGRLTSDECTMYEALKGWRWDASAFQSATTRTRESFYSNQPN